MKPEEYLKLPMVRWDGESAIYSDITEKYYRDIEEAESDLEEGQTFIDLQLMPCKAQYSKLLDGSFYWDESYDEDIVIPMEIRKAMDVFNDSVKDIIISWYPLLKRLEIE